MGPMVSSVERPPWIPVQDMFPAGSIGSKLLSETPDDLGMRLRPETALEQSYPYFFPSRENNWGRLTFDDILRLPFQEVAQVTPNLAITENRLKDFLMSFRILPHSRLLAEAYDELSFPAPVNREQEIIEGVEYVLDRIRPKRRTVLILYFGLYDGITQTLEKISKMDSKVVTKEAVRQSKADGLKELRRVGGDYLRGYVALSEISIGRKVFRADLVKDLPGLAGEEKLENLGLSSDIFEAMENAGFSRFRDQSIEELVMADLSEVVGIGSFNLTEEGISLALQRRVVEVAEKAEQKAQVEAQILAGLRAIIQAKVTKRGEPMNNLMPEIELSRECLIIMDGVPLADANVNLSTIKALRRRGSNIGTVGELLRQSKKQFLSTHNIGSTRSADTLEKLAKFCLDWKNSLEA